MILGVVFDRAQRGRPVFAACALAVVMLLTVGRASAESLVERGNYLVNSILGCGNCHTPIGPQGRAVDKALSGGLRFDTPAFDVFASNITPDGKTGIGGWTDAEIKTAIADGVRPDGTHLAPVMPYEFYKAFTPRDLDAVVAYLRTVKPIDNQMPTPNYKAAFHAAVVPGTEKPITEAEQRADPLRRGHYLALIGHCMECHTPRIKGAPQFDRMGAGGMEFDGPWGVSVAANITSDPAKGLGAWSDGEIKRAITEGIGRDGRKLKPPMAYGAYARMVPDDLEALVAYIRTVPAAR